MPRKKPAQGLLLIQILQAGPGFVGGGNVNKGQAGARDDLDDEAEQGSAAEHIEPAAGAGRDMVAGCGFEELRDVEPIVDPKRN